MPHEFWPTIRIPESQILYVGTFGEHENILQLDRYFDEHMQPIDEDERIRRVRAKPKEPFFIERGILVNGHPEIDHSLVPKQLRLSYPKAELPKMWPHSAKFGGTFLVNEAIKGCIEALEPDVHEFYPVSILRTPEDTSPLDHPPYWLLNICNLIHGVDMSQPAMRWDENSPDFYQYRRWKTTSNKLIFNERRVTNKHLWREKGCPRWRICSTELRDALEGVGVRQKGTLSFATVSSDDPDV